MATPRRPNPIAPLLTLALLAGLAVDTLSRPRPEDAEPYHQRVRRAAHDLPRVVGDWVGHDVPPTEGAVELLKPNVLYQRSYVNARTGRRVDVLLVHCKDARDLYGHYPPICYPAQGMRQRDRRPARWRVGGRRLPGVEYEFAGRGFGGGRLVVANLILMPRGAVRDMDAVGRSAWDYLTRFHGAGQLQVVFRDPGADRGRRNEIFRTMARAHMPAIEAILGDPR